MQLHDTLSKSKLDIQPSDGQTVRIYSCGPTVYDYPHIGNWYAFLRWDLLNRTLLASGLKTNWVMNITDVGHLVSDGDEGQDKLEKGASREGKTAWDVASYYGDYFIDKLKQLNFSTINTLPKATEHIPEQIDLVSKLEAAGYTYQIDDGVYFDTSKLSDYGKLAGLDIEGLQEGARVESNQQKRNPTDFAVWKLSPADQQRDMEWDSPWGKGFPGWHLECSAMAEKYLGTNFDIHTGGIDHIPVHHTNEIAQSEAANEQPLARIWVHGNFIKVDGKKMSKSLGNFYTLEDVLEQGYSLMEFRLATFASHYATESNFSWKLMHEAHERLSRLQAMADLKHQPQASQPVGNDYFQDLSADLLASLADDLNSPQCLMLLDRAADDIIQQGLALEDIPAFNSLLEHIDSLLGTKLADRQDISDKHKQTLKQRQQARDNKDWSTSDQLRDELKEAGLIVSDGTQGQTWTSTT